ncbi:hypothetical protein SLS64_012379 [Diaporthe eres]
MSGYNDLFNFNTSDGAHDMPGSLNAEAAPTMDQSGTWNTAVYLQSGMMEGGTAAQLHARLDFAPLEGARSNGHQNKQASHSHLQIDFGAKHACAQCLCSLPTDAALHQHAKATEHKAYKCKCGTSFNKDSALKRHIDTKDAPKTFACSLCSDKFNRKDKLKDHCSHYHKVTDEGLRNLFNSQGARPRAAASRRHRAPVPLAAASSASAPTLAPALPPVLASAPVGSPLWSLAASTGQQYASFPAGPFVQAGPLATTSSFVPVSSFDSAADLFTAALAPSEDIAGVAGDFLGDETWATGLDGFNF